MNDIFDPARFGRLCRAHWAENWFEYAWFAGVTAMLDLIFVMIFFSNGARNSFQSFQFESQIVWYSSGLFVTALILAGRHFRTLTDPGPALITLMRPASNLEKCLLAFMATGVLYPLAYTLLWSLLNFPLVELARHWYIAPPVCNECDYKLADFRFYIPFFSAQMPQPALPDGHLFLRHQFFMVLLLWSLQGVIVGGTLFYRRSPILRTGVSLFLLSILLVWMGVGLNAGGFWSAADREAAPYSALESALSLALWAGLPLLLWLTAFFHLKHREVS